MIGRKDDYFTEKHGNVFLLVIMLHLKMWFLFTGRETMKSEIISKVLIKDSAIK